MTETTHHPPSTHTAWIAEARQLCQAILSERLATAAAGISAACGLDALREGALGLAQSHADVAWHELSGARRVLWALHRDADAERVGALITMGALLVAGPPLHEPVAEPAPETLRTGVEP